MKKIDSLLLIITIVLVSIGIIFIFSASSVMAQKNFQSSIFFLKKQLLVAILGIILLWIIAKKDLSFLKNISPIILFISFVFLIIAFIPGIGIKGRWIKLGFFIFQPSELAKLSLILFISQSLANKKNIEKNGFKEFIPYLIILGTICGLILLGSDFGTTLVVGLSIFSIFFVAKIKIKYLLSVALISAPFLFMAVYKVSYRCERIISFLNPWKDPLKSGYQLIQSFYAFGSGGLIGKGIGNSSQKLFFLPAAHTDFIFSIIGEELGFIGTILIISLFILFIYRGIKIAIKSSDLFAIFFSIGFTGMIALQVIINICTSLGIFPTKGIPLPFVSYGCSSLLMNLIGVGILLNFSRQIKTNKF
ncbi:MAG: putative lipid II flippase FtsW [bacterium]